MVLFEIAAAVLEECDHTAYFAAIGALALGYVPFFRIYNRIQEARIADLKATLAAKEGE